MLQQTPVDAAQPSGTGAPPNGGGDAPARALDAQTAIDAANLAQAAGELLGPVQIEFVEGLDVIVLRGADRDVERVMQIIEQIEQLSAVTTPTVEVYPLKNVDSRALGALLSRLYQQVLGPRIGDVSITPLVKPNSLLLVGRPENVRMAIELIQRLDVPVAPATRFEVFPLKNASAADAKTMIDQFLEQAEVADEEQPARRSGRRRRWRREALVVADVRTNSLIVSAAPRDLAEIATLVGADRLAERRGGGPGACVPAAQRRGHRNGHRAAERNSRTSGDDRRRRECRDGSRPALGRRPWSFAASAATRSRRSSRAC